MNAKDKIRKLHQLKHTMAEIRRKKLRTVFTNGCFDLLHIGHLRYLEAAKSLGDVLIVGMNTDGSVRRLKGEGRPIMPESERAELLCGFHCVDHVILFDSPDPLPLIERVQPHVLVKGADWSLENIVGADRVRASGGEVVRIPVIPQASTTRIIEKIVQRFAHLVSSPE